MENANLLWEGGPENTEDIVTHRRPLRGGGSACPAQALAIHVPARLGLCCGRAVARSAQRFGAL
jgi:hypothetical protein